MKTSFFNFFLKGMGSILVLSPEMPPVKSDAESIKEDWENVGNYLRTAMGDIEEEMPILKEPKH